jgi:transposase
MGRPYSQDPRSRIVAAVESGTSRNKAAQQFAVSVSCVVKMQRLQLTGTMLPAARGKKPYALAEHEATVRELMATRPDLALDELHRALAARGIFAGRWSVNRFLHACGLTLKKSRCMRRNSNDQMKIVHDDDIASRKCWGEHLFDVGEEDGAIHSAADGKLYCVAQSEVGCTDRHWHFSRGESDPQRAGATSPLIPRNSQSMRASVCKEWAISGHGTSHR